MPFFYDQTVIEVPDDGVDLPAPRVDQFGYLSPMDYGDTREPVTFSIDVPEKPAPTPKYSAPPRQGLLNRLLRGAPPAGPARDALRAEIVRAAQVHARYRQQLVLSLAVSALREIGGRRAYCRYDGGNDEGFSWLDNVEVTSGERIGIATLAEKLQALGFGDRLHAAGLIRSDPRVPAIEQVRSFVRAWPSSEWASLLLGSGYGTGEHLMYGAFTVDLEACTILDDPRADPIVENIEIAT